MKALTYTGPAGRYIDGPSGVELTVGEWVLVKNETAERLVKAVGSRWRVGEGGRGSEGDAVEEPAESEEVLGPDPTPPPPTPADRAEVVVPEVTRGKRISGKN